MDILRIKTSFRLYLNYGKNLGSHSMKAYTQKNILFSFQRYEINMK